MVLQKPVRLEMVLQDAVRLQIATVEGEEEVAQPSMLGILQAVEDRVEEQLAEVVDGVGDEGCDRKVVRSALTSGGAEVVELDTCEVEEGGAVVVGELVLALIVVGADAVEGGVDNCFYAVEGVENAFALVEVLAGFGNLLEA